VSSVGAELHPPAASRTGFGGDEGSCVHRAQVWELCPDRRRVYTSGASRPDLEKSKRLII
jgi:hypothetical protein